MAESWDGRVAGDERAEGCGVSSAQSDGVVVVRVVGELDMYGVEAFDARLRAVDVGPGMTGLQLDLGGVTFIDSSGIRAVLRARAQMVGSGLEFGISEASADVCRVFVIAGIDDLLLA